MGWNLANYLIHTVYYNSTVSRLKHQLKIYINPSRVLVTTDGNTSTHFSLFGQLHNCKLLIRQTVTVQGVWLGVHVLMKN